MQKWCSKKLFHAFFPWGMLDLRSSHFSLSTNGSKVSYWHYFRSCCFSIFSKSNLCISFLEHIFQSGSVLNQMGKKYLYYILILQTLCCCCCCCCCCLNHFESHWSCLIIYLTKCFRDPSNSIIRTSEKTNFAISCSYFHVIWIFLIMNFLMHVDGILYCYDSYVMVAFFFCRLSISDFVLKWKMRQQ